MSKVIHYVTRGLKKRKSTNSPSVSQSSYHSESFHHSEPSHPSPHHSQQAEEVDMTQDEPVVNQPEGPTYGIEFIKQEHVNAFLAI